MLNFEIGLVDQAWILEAKQGYVELFIFSLCLFIDLIVFGLFSLIFFFGLIQ